MVEFSLLSGLVVLTVLAVVQLALFLYQRNVVVTAISEGARVGASFGRRPEDGEAAACELIRQAIGERCDALRVTAARRGGLVVVAADGNLPPITPGLPALSIHHVATMHDEERLYPGLLASPRPTAIVPDARVTDAGVTDARVADADYVDPGVAGRRLGRERRWPR